MNMHETVSPWTDDSISVIIPTFQRSPGLQEALKSVASQTVDADKIKVIIVDNNPTPQEQRRVAALSPLFHNPIIYVHVTEAGLCNARNAAMAKVDTRFVAFLDDDMIASPDWLPAMMATAHTFEAGIVFGPVFAKMPNPDDARNPYLANLFSRLIDTKDEGLVQTTLGAGGCLLDLERCDMPSPPFDPDLNKRGGEDDILFDRLRLQGTRVAWSPTASCLEVVPEKRTRAAYIRSRNFGFGQGPARIHASRGWAGLPGIFYFTATGGIQLALYGSGYFVTSLQNKPSSVKYLALAAQGLGKIFWGNRFSLDLYGQAEANPKDVCESDICCADETCQKPN